MTLEKSRTVIGRKGADFALNDPEVSRHHCVLEVRDGFVNLKDLDSTNGTFFAEERVRAAVLAGWRGIPGGQHHDPAELSIKVTRKIGVHGITRECPGRV